MTAGNSLRTWDRVGILDRELAIYRRLSKENINVSIVSYGGPREVFYKYKLKDIGLVWNFLRLPHGKYVSSLTKFLPFLYDGNVIFKSNQVWGADIPLRIAQTHKNEFIARCGFLPSKFYLDGIDHDSAEYNEIVSLESQIFQNASHVVVTTKAICQSIIQDYGIKNQKVTVIPNYVDTDLFKPELDERGPKKICTVGRLTEKKNIFALLDAIKGLDVTLDVIGTGELLVELEKKVKTEELPVRFLGRIAHNKLSDLMNQASLFVLPSLVEGHPKVLCEAMACGLPIIGTNVEGTREMIEHKVNGYLCGTSAEALRSAITQVLANRDLAHEMGRGARAFAQEHYSLDKIVQKELTLIRKLAQG